MGYNYLSSRTEILRSMFIDTGISIAMIGSPVEFNEWIDSGIPEDTVILSNHSEIGYDALFDRILLWDENDVDVDPGYLLDHIKKDGEIWVVMPTMGELRDSILMKYDPLKEMGHDPIPLTLALEIYPVYISTRLG